MKVFALTVVGWVVASIAAWRLGASTNVLYWSAVGLATVWIVIACVWLVLQKRPMRPETDAASLPRAEDRP